MHRFPLVLAFALLSACAAVREARMEVAEPLRAVAEEPFGRSGWGRSGSFALGEQQVRYERSAERLSLFESYSRERASLRISLSGAGPARVADCGATQSELSRGLVAVPAKPWSLVCSWQGAGGPEAQLRIGEARGQGALQTREGEYRRGDQLLSLRSVHRLAGAAWAQQQAVGYEMLHQGRVVGSVDLSRGSPVLRRPDPATPQGQAVTEAALALALVWEPA